MALLRVEEVSVAFDGLVAVDRVSLGVDRGRVTGLIGPNGAGKTTLFNVVTGLQPPTRGRVLLDDDDITDAPPHRRARRGIARTFQRLEVFGTLNVFENVLVAAEMRRGWSRDASSPGHETREALERVGLSGVSSERVDTLPTGTIRLVELARALVTHPRVLLLDEPSSGLGDSETHVLGTLLRELAGEGLAVFLVEHDMALVMPACDHIHVLDFGQLIAEGTPDQVRSNPAVRAAYLGDDRGSSAKQPAVARAQVSKVTEPAEGAVVTTTDHAAQPERAIPVLELRNIRAGYGAIEVLQGVDLHVTSGTILTLVGPNGAGKSTTLKVASGQLAPTSGTVALCGREVNGASPDALARAGLRMVPEGRGIFPNLTVTENLVMATHAGVRLGDLEEQTFTRYPILGNRRQQIAGTLSGGEQQMLAMARVLATDPAVLLLDELSNGLAPIIVEDLYHLVRQVADEGIAVLVVEQFANEALGVADVAALMLHGRVERFGAPEVVSEELASAYLGASNEHG